VIILYMNKSYNIIAEKKKMQEKKKIKLQREIG